jgi:sulfatase modifying factor 1
LTPPPEQPKIAELNDIQPENCQFRTPGASGAPHKRIGSGRPFFVRQSCEQFHQEGSVMTHRKCGFHSAQLLRVVRVAITCVGLAALDGGLSVRRAVAVTIETVHVGDPGNAPDQRLFSVFGGVNYSYSIGTTEVTNSQYAEFLNAKATSDPYDLYASSGIVRSGQDGSYTYSAKPTMADKPVTHVTWHSAVRFANWLHNGQGVGDTETGAYTLLGDRRTPTNDASITRNSGAIWFLPTRDEWYKAAYYDPTLNDGLGGYWTFPTHSNVAPTLATANSVGDIDNPGANVANYYFGADWNGRDGNVTTVGSAGPLSKTYYGTSDQGGNVLEWAETLVGSDNRVLRSLEQLLQSAGSVEREQRARGVTKPRQRLPRGNCP